MKTSSEDNTTVSLDVKAAELRARKVSREWKKIRKSFEEDMYSNKVTITKLKKMMEKAGEMFKAKYQLRIMELQQKEEVKRLADLKEEGKETWTEIRDMFKRNIDEVGAELKAFLRGDDPDDDNAPRAG